MPFNQILQALGIGHWALDNIEEYIRRTDEMLARKQEIFPET